MRIDYTITGITFFLTEALWIHFYDLDQVVWQWAVYFPPHGVSVQTPLFSVGFTPERRD